MLATLLPALKELAVPLKLQLWDGKEIDIGPAPSVTLVIRTPASSLSWPVPAWMCLAPPMSKVRSTCTGRWMRSSVSAT